MQDDNAVMSGPVSGLPKHGDQLELRPLELDDDGLALARFDLELHGERRRMRVIARGALPGDKALVQIDSRKRDTLFGRLVEILEPAPGRIEPACQHARFSREVRYCGGCTLQALDYPSQKVLKRERVVRAMAQQGLDLEVADIRPAPIIFGHRHKMELSFASDRRGDAVGELQMGLHPPGMKWEVVNLQECHLLSPEMSAFLPKLRTIFQESGLHAWDPRDLAGVLRTVSVREGKRLDTRLIDIVTVPAAEFTQAGIERPAAEVMQAIADAIVAAAQEAQLTLSSVIWTEHDAQRGRPTAYHLHTLWGNSSLRDALEVPAGTATRLLEFDISPRAFFQPHPRSAENIIKELHRRLPEGCRTLLDLYCGTGTLGLALAPSAEQVLGIELIADAVVSANANAAANGLHNARFIAGDVGAELARLRDETPEVFASVDAALLDPPRSGLSPQAIETLAAIRPKRLLYVSCKPESLARDIRALIAHGYRVEGGAQPVDLFPHSQHVETIVALTTGEA